MCVCVCVCVCVLSIHVLLTKLGRFPRVLYCTHRREEIFKSPM